ncbi:hypothetical protein [Candidatus Palauibacter sp.]|uniref:hypothetical protein n=1 Tax=Candidatus Palauibacter sp. TaxID=3101350 RepID=UPI003C6F1E1F
MQRLVGVAVFAAISVTGCDDAGFEIILPRGDPARGACVPLPDGAQHWWPGDGTGEEEIRAVYEAQAAGICKS